MDIRDEPVGFLHRLQTNSPHCAYTCSFQHHPYSCQDAQPALEYLAHFRQWTQRQIGSPRRICAPFRPPPSTRSAEQAAW
jgi:hypothetical protein